MSQRLKPKRRIEISDEKKTGKIRVVMKQKSRFFGWYSQYSWRVSSSDFYYLRYLIQSWDREDFDTQIENSSSTFVYEKTS